jgi:hypothetical protein
MNTVRKRSPDRYDELKINFFKQNRNFNSNLIEDWKLNGDKILLCPITEKSISFYRNKKVFLNFIKNNPNYLNLLNNKKFFKKNDTEILLRIWEEEVIKNIKKHTDLPILIRRKDGSREDRLASFPIQKQLDVDRIRSVVTFNSIVSVESILHGVSALSLGDNATLDMGLVDFSWLTKPFTKNRENWLYNLTYSQFTREELINGTAMEILND